MIDVERLALVFRENGYWDAYAVMVDHGKVVESEYARLTPNRESPPTSNPASDRNEPRTAAGRNLLADMKRLWSVGKDADEAILAIESEATERAIGAVIDVERLRTATTNAIAAATEDGPDLSDLIAAEYARLTPASDRDAPRDLSVLDFIGTLRWIANNGGIPAEGSDREARLVALWERRLRLPATERAIGGLDEDRLLWAVQATNHVLESRTASMVEKRDRLARAYTRLSDPNHRGTEE